MSWPVPQGRWVFEMKTTLSGGRHVSKNEAWGRCVAAGLRAGIPQHAWRKSHDGGYWRWFVASAGELEKQERMIAKRRGYAEVA